MQEKYARWHNLDPDMATQALDQAINLATSIQLVDGTDIGLTVRLWVLGLGFEIAPGSLKTDRNSATLCLSLVSYLSRPCMPL